jgi:ABC-type nitrate/sulfonate/bicarbonate transport system substrate-binding protein
VSDQTDLRLGFIPLVDCAPLVVAVEMGFFADEGLSVTLSREASWANIRDKIAVGALDGAHMLGPMALATSLGVAGAVTPTLAPLALNTGGSAITVSKTLSAALAALADDAPLTARPLARLIAARASAGDPPLTFAVVFPHSIHNYQLRYWLAEAGIDPDKDVRIVVAPPPSMAERLRSGQIDGFCVGAPWNAVSVLEGAGEVLIRASDFWRGAPDKVFGVTRAWAQSRPDQLQAILRALLRAGVWADQPDNRAPLAAILAAPNYVGSPEAALAASLSAPASRAAAPVADRIVFHDHAAAFPWRSHAVWFLTQMLRWGQISESVDIPALAEAVYRPDLFRTAAASLGLAAPLVDEKVEGAHAAAWTLDEATAPIPMAGDLFFDGKVFDAGQPLAYARSFAIRRGRPPEF